MKHSMPIRDLADDLPYLVDVELAGQHRPLEPEFLQLPDAEGVVDGHLGRGVQRDPREVCPGQSRHRQVLEDDSVHPHPLQRGKGIDQAGKLVLLDEGVEGHVDPAVTRMGVGEHPLQLVQGEVFRLGPGGKFLEPRIHGVRPFFHGREKGLERPGRGEEFRFLAVKLAGFFVRHKVRVPEQKNGVKQDCRLSRPSPLSLLVQLPSREFTRTLNIAAMLLE